MTSEVIYFTNSFVTLISILDPFGATIILLALTPGYEQQRRSQIVNRAAKATLTILVAFAVAGGLIFMAFGISIHALSVAGGLILASLSFRMILGEPITSNVNDERPEKKGPEDDVAIIPLAMPMMAGPGAMGAVTVFAHRATGWVEYGLLMAAIIMATGLSWLILQKSQRISDLMGENGTKVMVRVMGLILLAMGAEFTMSGVKGYFG